MNIESAKDLLKVADKLDKVKDKFFDMCTWGTKEPHCGTKHCVLGWAATVPSLKNKGLELVPLWDDTDCKDFDVAFGNERGADAGREFFDLTDTEAIRLFMNFGGTKKQMANIIRAVVGYYHPDLVKVSVV